MHITGLKKLIIWRTGNSDLDLGLGYLLWQKPVVSLSWVLYAFPVELPRSFFLEWSILMLQMLWDFMNFL